MQCVKCNGLLVDCEFLNTDVSNWVNIAKKCINCGYIVEEVYSRNQELSRLKRQEEVGHLRYREN